MVGEGAAYQVPTWSAMLIENAEMRGCQWRQSRQPGGQPVAPQDEPWSRLE